MDHSKKDGSCYKKRQGESCSGDNKGKPSTRETTQKFMSYAIKEKKS